MSQSDSKVDFGSIDGSKNPVVLSDFQTRNGFATASLRHRSQTDKSVTLFSETGSAFSFSFSFPANEVAGVLALEAGTIVAKADNSSSSSFSTSGYVNTGSQDSIMVGANVVFSGGDDEAGSTHAALVDGILGDSASMQLASRGGEAVAQFDFIAPSASSVDSGSTDSFFGDLEETELAWWQQ